MHLKEIVIDGFKSYATRTVVKDFDASFNAITGLNGSGKSNVLDSICFVLGITNLSQVRAGSLQDLVYKQGQAGVTKATVTLIFNNVDKATSPVGYEQPDEITITRQIVIGGRNKYLINGLNAQPGRVQNLFHSVGLNVNNPHFLIMQGRITKVINMKPLEVLSMIEEAAGTKMYEIKKEAALRTIEKKERKVEEINSLLEEKINPYLAKLERERKHYLEWNNNNNELASLKRYMIAYEFTQATKILNNAENSDLYDRALTLQNNLEEHENRHKEAEANLKSLIRSKDQQMEGGAIEKKQKSVDDLSKQLVKLQTSWSNQKQALKTEQDLQKKTEDSVKELESKKESNTVAVEQAKAELTAAEETVRKASEELQNAETAMLTGTSSAASQSAATGSVTDQLEAARRKVSQLQTTIETLNREKVHLSEVLKEKSGELARDRANVRKLEQEKKNAEKHIADAKIALHELDFDPVVSEELTKRLDEEREIVRTLEDKVGHLSGRLSNCEFAYSDPRPNFDRRKVHGLVARLIRVKDSKMITAIEITAGGRLYQVVVDNDATANDLLRHGRLRRRVTILPLNKIRHEVISDAKLENARELESGVELALDLVDYNGEVGNAMKHVFGRTLVCPDINSARRVTFDNRVRARTVTPEGDTYDPSGTLAGGSSRNEGSSVLTLLRELNDAENELETHKANLVKLQSQVQQIDEKSRRWRQLKASLDVRCDEAKFLEKRLDETATGRLLKEVDTLRERVTSKIPQSLQLANEELTAESSRVEELETAMSNSAAAKEKVQREAAEAIEKLRNESKNASTKLQQANGRLSSLSVELETLDDEVKRLQQHLNDTVLPSVSKLSAEVTALEEKVASIRKSFEESNKSLQSDLKHLQDSNREIASSKASCESLSEKVESLGIEKAKIDSKIREADKGKARAKELVRKLEDKHGWITQEKDSFNVEGSQYEFSKQKISFSRKRMETLENQQGSLAKKINKKAMHMFETAKDEYRALMSKKAIIEQDKEKIEKVIKGLDEKKMIAVEKTWRKVNHDFGNIFSDLLPGVNAKLEPPSGQSVEDGLEIKVAFGNVWKDSLSELSGGQRSLIALSLILAMLRFKPAPMYILDEVDAALDLSHTQNIGRMLRRHFSGSQFIVVSLKEGMFSNANVIFRTKFVDGVSTIKRTENRVTRDEGEQEATSTGKGVTEDVLNKENISASPGTKVTVAGRKRRARS